jgi:tetratricopeptide (TPR) repeat protein
MKPSIRFVLSSFLICTILAACGPSPAELDATSTQAAANIFATQTAQVLTATAMFTPSPTATVTPTATASPTNTPTPNLAATAAAYYKSGRANSEKGEWELAISDYDQAIQFRPDYPEAYYHRGIAWTKQGDLDQAVADFSQTIQLNPGYVDAYNIVGWLMPLGFTELAIEDYNQAIELDPEYSFLTSPWCALLAIDDLEGP